MKLIKYWRVQLFKAENRGMAPGNAEVLIFEGYSKDKPKIKLGAGAASSCLQRLTHWNPISSVITSLTACASSLCMKMMATM